MATGTSALALFSRQIFAGVVVVGRCCVTQWAHVTRWFRYLVCVDGASYFGQYAKGKRHGEDGDV